MKRTMLGILLLTAIGGFSLAVKAPVAIDGVYPDSGPPGTSVILKGHGFINGDTNTVWSSNTSPSAPPGRVDFAGALADIRLWQDNMIVVTVPEDAQSGPVRLSLPSGIVLSGNHFEITNEEGESTPLRHDYAFLEKSDSGGCDAVFFSRGFNPYPGYYYRGYRPRYMRAWRGCDIARGPRGDGFFDYFMVSGPMMGMYHLYTGLDDVMVFPGDFYGSFQDRRDWYYDNVSSPVPGSNQTNQPRKRHYAFLED